MQEPPRGDETDSAPLLTVAAVARRLGVAPATLRTWDRRYGLGPTGHLAGSHRRYRPTDVRRLNAMRSLTLRGMPLGDAARAVLAGDPHADGGYAGAAPVAEVQAAEAAGGTADQDAAAVFADTAMARRTVDGGRGTAPRRRGGGRSLALPGADEDVRGLATAAMALDQAAVLGTLRAAIRRIGAARTWLEIVRPILVAIGQRWETTGDCVEVEHMVSAAAIAAFVDAAAAPDPPHGRAVLLAAAPEEMHDLPLYALAATLGEHGVGVRMLGARVPAAALAAAVRRTGPSAVVVYALLPANASPGVLDAIPVTRPAVSVFAAGRGWSRSTLPRRVTAVDDISSARRLVMAAAGARPA